MYYNTFTTRAKLKHLTTQSTGENRNQRELSFNVGGRIHWHHHFRKIVSV
jgi:quercetin dioxygenase-like cupin family protein